MAFRKDFFLKIQHVRARTGSKQHRSTHVSVCNRYRILHGNEKHAQHVFVEWYCVTSSHAPLGHDVGYTVTNKKKEK